jgi:hypothetical protein
MLNKALRIPECLFIQQLHEQIINESISNTSLTVYLDQTINQNDLDELQKSSTNNGLLVFSQFLSASTDLSNAVLKPLKIFHVYLMIMYLLYFI